MNAKIKLSIFSIFLILLTGFCFAAESCTKTPGGADQGPNSSRKESVEIIQGAAKITLTDYCFNSSLDIAEGTRFADVLKLATESGITPAQAVQQSASGTYLLESTCSNMTVDGQKTYDQAIVYKCPSGCSNGACVAAAATAPESCGTAGIRNKSEYCSPDGKWLVQKNNDASCYNNFECTSNLCIDSKCVNQGILEMIINWFKSLFGIK